MGMLIQVNASLIPLTQGKVAVIDADDYEKVSHHKWCAVRSSRTWYAATNIKVKKVFKTILLHQLILGCHKGEIGDHKNHDGLDNRRENIRRCTRQQNNSNSRNRTNSTCLFKGVYQRKGIRLVNEWVAQITYKYNTTHIGCYGTAEDAARAYDQKAKELFGNFACLNFK